MQIIVNRMPETPEECIYARPYKPYDMPDYYACALGPVRRDENGYPRPPACALTCKDPCSYLRPIKEVVRIGN